MINRGSQAIRVVSLAVSIVLFAHLYTTSTPRSINADDTLALFQTLMTRGCLSEASKMIAEPATFRLESNGDWALTAPDEWGDGLSTVSATDSTWARRFEAGHFEKQMRCVDENDWDLETPCWLLMTGVMCDPLQADVRFVPTSDWRIEVDITPFLSQGKRHISLKHGP